MVRALMGMRAARSVLLTVLLAAGGQVADGQEGESDAANDLLKALEAMSQEMERFDEGAQPKKAPIVMIESSGVYPPGRYIGRCEYRREPENPQTGDRYEKRFIESTFFRLEDDGRWNGVASSSPRDAEDEYHCAANERYAAHAHNLGGTWKGNIRGPGRYRLRVTGYISRYVVEECVTVGGGPCPQMVSREDVDYEIPFEIEAPR